MNLDLLRYLDLERWNQSGHGLMVSTLMNWQRATQIPCLRMFSKL